MIGKCVFLAFFWQSSCIFFFLSPTADQSDLSNLSAERFRIFRAEKTYCVNSGKWYFELEVSRNSVIATLMAAIREQMWFDPSQVERTCNVCEHFHKAATSFWSLNWMKLLPLRYWQRDKWGWVGLGRDASLTRSWDLTTRPSSSMALRWENMFHDVFSCLVLVPQNQSFRFFDLPGPALAPG